MRRRAQLALVVGLAVVLVVIVAAMFGGSHGTRQAADQTPTGQPATEPPATEPPPATSSSPASPTGGPVALTDGIYLVGAEISAGTYVTTAGSRPCYWARLRSFGQVDSIIDDRNVEPGQSERVVVRSSDRGFKVSNGCTWRAELPV